MCIGEDGKPLADARLDISTIILAPLASSDPDGLERVAIDSGFAEARARSLAAKGWPPRRIAQLLAAEGIARPLIDGALATLAEDEAAGRGDLELETAIAFARRRRLGPFAPPDGPPTALAKLDA